VIRITLGHIVNPVRVEPESDLFVAQPITFESMRRARTRAADVADVAFFAAKYPEDRGVVPPDFAPTRELERSARDLVPALTARKLPFVGDICDRLYESSDAEYLVYTNVDVALDSSFYVRVAELACEGFDALAFARRNISDGFTSVDELPAMYAAPGKSQRGADCVVFRRELYPAFELGDVFVGEPGIGRVLVANLLRYGRRPALFADGELTFHIGNAGAWKRWADDAGAVNLERSLAIVERLWHDASEDRRVQIEPHLEALRRMLDRARASLSDRAQALTHRRAGRTVRAQCESRGSCRPSG
jgi:hypothetical protein